MQIITFLDTKKPTETKFQRVLSLKVQSINCNPLPRVK